MTIISGDAFSIGLRNYLISCSWFPYDDSASVLKTGSDSKRHIDRSKPAYSNVVSVESFVTPKIASERDVSVKSKNPWKNEMCFRNIMPLAGSHGQGHTKVNVDTI